MKAASIMQRLRDMGVPLDRARVAAERFGSDTAAVPLKPNAAHKAIAREARHKAVEQHRREFRTWCRANGLPNPTHEYAFARASHKRGWLFDWAWPDADGRGGVALEIEGGVYSGGRHVRPAGYLGDVDKYNAANALGWRLVRCTWSTLYTDDTLTLLRALLLPSHP